MKTVSTLLLVVGLTGFGAAQEKPVPKDSQRISITGCASGVVFTVVRAPQHELTSSVAPGRRFRLAGKKEMINDIRAREGVMLEVTGLIKKGQLEPGGSGVRMGPGPSPLGGTMGRNANFDQVILDVENWRSIPGECPSR